MTVLDGDRGEVDSGVRRTALGFAMARAKETTSKFPLFTDPYAQLLLDAAGPLESVSTAERSTAEDQHYAAARTKWFDEFFLTASSGGVSQVVILAPGLDTRAWRLPWLSDTVIYEVDQQPVLDFKQRVIEKSGVTPSARRIAVAPESREDWPKSLTAVGFDYTEPTAWAGEGLLNCLDAHAMSRLLDRIDLYSARGSRIAVESHPRSPVDVSCWLCTRHWEVKTIPATELMSRYHRAPATGDSVFVVGRKL